MKAIKGFFNMLTWIIVIIGVWQLFNMWDAYDLQNTAGKQSLEYIDTDQKYKVNLVNKDTLPSIFKSAHQLDVAINNIKVTEDKIGINITISNTTNIPYNKKNKQQMTYTIARADNLNKTGQLLTVSNQNLININVIKPGDIITGTLIFNKPDINDPSVFYTVKGLLFSPDDNLKQYTAIPEFTFNIYDNNFK